MAEPSPPSLQNYETSNGSYFSAFENEVKPSYIAKPNSVKQVQDLIRVLRPHLLSGHCQVAVRGTGHTPFAGSANVQDGITIDTRGLKGIILSEDKSAVEIAAGETWADVYAELEKHGLTVAGGRVGRIGVAGLVLGGALSMFSGRTGFACDTVLEFEVVLASGEVVRASAEEHPDLWTSLRGGLNNFGIVTSLKMQAFESGDIWGGVTYYMPDAFPSSCRTPVTLSRMERTRTPTSWPALGTDSATGSRRVSCTTPRARRTRLRCSASPQWSRRSSRWVPCGSRRTWASITIKPDVSLMEAFHQKWEETLEKVKDAEGFIFSFGFHPITKALLENSANAGGNAMNIPASDGPLFVVLINPIWKNADDDGRIFAEVGSLVTGLRQLARDKGLLHRYIFTNYGYSEDDVIAGYGEESVSRLREASKIYDPEGVFQRGVPGGFKLAPKGS